MQAKSSLGPARLHWSVPWFDRASDERHCKYPPRHVTHFMASRSLLKVSVSWCHSQQPNEVISSLAHASVLFERDGHVGGVASERSHAAARVTTASVHIRSARIYGVCYTRSCGVSSCTRIRVGRQVQRRACNRVHNLWVCPHARRAWQWQRALTRLQSVTRGTKWDLWPATQNSCRKNDITCS